MRTVKLRFLIVFVVVGWLGALAASPADAVTIIWQATNTDVSLGLPFWDLEFENPLAGTEMVKGYAVLEWRDADYSAGPPRWYDDWSVSHPSEIDGNADQIWMRRVGHSISTATTVPSTVVSIHLAGDRNDGLTEVLVDGKKVAKLDMATPSPPAENALIIVKHLANTPHRIEVHAVGVGQYGGMDVATLGAAALAKSKWVQPPERTGVDNLYYGWNELSDYNGVQIVADDWVCQTRDPVTDIHWWGSFKGWKKDEPPLLPQSFHITIWTDVPDPNPGDPDTFSHPKEVVWDIDCQNFNWEFVGWDYDPRTGCLETCFRFDQILEEWEYFYQEPNDVTPNIYWISIAAKYPSGTTVEYPWGWKTRPRDVDSPAPDDAVRIFSPTAPHIGSRYAQGEPIWWPDPNKSWDMAFELTARPVLPSVKWEQQPDPDLPGLHAHDWLEFPAGYRQITLADDWECHGGDVSDLHWYGNYEMAAVGGEMRGAGIDHFHLSIHDCGGGTPWCLPMEPPAWVADVPFTVANETDTGLVNSEGSRIYRYEYYLTDPFLQATGMFYWFDVTAVCVDPCDPAFWRWQEANRSTVYLGHAPGAEKTESTPWRSIVWGIDPERYSDFAYAVTSVGFGEMYVKWSQPPVPYQPEAYNGWNEFSVYNSTQIVADDWFCETAAPVTDIHWWGSYIGWSCEQPPLEVPESFHIAIWTDVPAGADEDFSHPGRVIWETDCSEFTCEFVGWDIDPRDPFVPPEACFKFEQDIPEENWFYQEAGGNIYWVSIAAKYPAGAIVDNWWGWKTRRRDPNSRAPDDAVMIWNPTAPGIGDIYLNGMPIWWPAQTDSWDMAFVLTTKEKEPKPLIERSKWSQPPIEIDPNLTETPVYCGWDEESWNQDPNNWFSWSAVADDFRCIGTGPVSSVHWWGSHVAWLEPVPPEPQPIAWTFRFWSNVPANPDTDPCYSHPGALLWEFMVDGDRVHWEWVGNDEFPELPLEACFQYYVALNEDEYFWQHDYRSADGVFWLGITAVYPNNVDVQYPWGWKTRPWSWMDDAVMYECRPDGTGNSICRFWPIEDPVWHESFDVSFELDTEPNWIKWEQPYTGIRHWRHYEDERSIAVEDASGAVNIIRLVADDWLCRGVWSINAVTWWGSYIGYRYEACRGPALRPPAPDYFLLMIWDDVPAGVDLTYSHPGQVLWKYKAYEYDEVLVGYDKHPEDVAGPPREPVFRYSVRLPDPNWFQQKAADAIYWLSVVAVYKDNVPSTEWGWTNHEHSFNDDAVAGTPDPGGPGVWTWSELFDQTETSCDMSFTLFRAGCRCWGDIAGSISPLPDGVVNTADLAKLLGLLGPLGGSTPPYEICPVPAGFECMDIAGSLSPAPDGCINTADLGALLAYLGPLGGSTPPYEGPCMPDPNP